MNPPSAHSLPSWVAHAPYLVTEAPRWFTDEDLPALIEKARELRRIGLGFTAEEVGGPDRLRRIHQALDAPTTNRASRRRAERAARVR